MKKTVVGILAHVDAGKTTLSEAMLYHGGHIKKLGRVDKQNAFFDTFQLERERGITIFSKQASLAVHDMKMTLLDTPGHVDFSAEMERTLQVLDYGILVISASDGVQGHTRTLWRLLQKYRIPTFIFVNKMDAPGAEKAKVLRQLQDLLSTGCIDFTENQDADTFMENVAVSDDDALAVFLGKGTLSDSAISKLIMRRTVFPCFFGSALKLQGVEEFLEGLSRFMRSPVLDEEFGAKVFKITRDSQGNRLTHLKITGGSLKVKTLMPLGDEETVGEKINEIRIYSGVKYEAKNDVRAGDVCAVTGLTGTYPGQGLGEEVDTKTPELQPVMNYQCILPQEIHPHQALENLRILQDEDPLLHVEWNEQLQKIHLQLMGEIQLEVLKRLIMDRFSMDIRFGPGSVIYKETVNAPVIGMGHFEPLRHYAEVHLLLEPGERDSGLVFRSRCSLDVLSRNWQNLVLTHLKEAIHPGVLTGSPITDMKITLLTGRAHIKHTQGGDFRQATHRALQHGLKTGKSLLLEPWYEYRMELPGGSVGRAISDIQKMNGSFQSEAHGDYTLLTGEAPVSQFQNYAAELGVYSHGQGRLFCSVAGYRPCHNAQAVIDAIGYNSESNPEFTADSVFCSHGSGFIVKWYEAEGYMHLESRLEAQPAHAGAAVTADASSGKTTNRSDSLEMDKELMAIFERTYGPVKAPMFYSPKAPNSRIDRSSRLPAPVPEYLLVDGYNIIFAWKELADLARDSIDAARQQLMDLLCSYQALKGCTVILVFDAYKVKRDREDIVKYHNIFIVYTKEAETADTYIEKATYALGKQHKVSVATSDYTEQLIILAHGALRIPAEGFRREMADVYKEIEEIVQAYRKDGGTKAVGAAWQHALLQKMERGGNGAKPTP